ncbi:SH3 and multiple ankyrin repeat domain protein 3 [Taenia solium]|eukprot:TsM_000352800 transcript=TsM_000352800 gene=TsM_000352800
MAYVKKCLLPDFEPDRANLRNSVASSVASSITVQVPLPTSQLVHIGVKCPATGAERIYVVESTESVGHLRRNAVMHSELDFEEAVNYGLYLPPQAGKKGKFLEDERPIADYPVLLQCSDHRSRNTDDSSSVSSATATITNGLHNSPDSGVGQDPCWLELIYKSRMDAEDSPHHSRLRKLKTKVTQNHFMDMVRDGDVKGVEKLLAKGFDPNFWSRKDGEAPITAAATTFHPRDMIIALVNGGAHIDFRARDSHTALHRAAICGNYEAIQTLLDLGQNPNCRDRRGLTPLYHAVSTDISARCTHALLYDHAILGVEDSKGFQEIHQACAADRPQHLENLIAYGADLNARTMRGQTPLHLCVSHEANACLSLLLQRGADVNQVNADSQTPLDYALLTNRNEQVDILRHFDPANIGKVEEEVCVHFAFHQRIFPPRLISFSQNMSFRSSYNTLRRPMVNGPRAAVAYTMLHRPSSTCSMADSLNLCQGSLSPSESLFSSDQVSVTSFTGANCSAACTSTTTIAPSRSMQNIYRHENECAATGPVKQLQQLAGTPRTRKANVYNGYEGTKLTPPGAICYNSSWGTPNTPTRITSSKAQDFGSRPGVRSSLLYDAESRSPISFRGVNSPTGQFYFRFSEQKDENTYTRIAAMRRGREGFGFTLNGVPRMALQRHDRQPLPNTPSNQYFSSVVPGGPADRAGIREGDYVIEIDGQDVTNACHEDAVECIKNCGDSLIVRVMSVYRASTPRQLNGPSELSQDSCTYRRRRQSDVIHESSSSGTSSNSANSDTEVAVRTSFAPATRKLGVSEDREQRGWEPVEANVRSRSRERRYRNPSVRSQSYSVGKAEIRLNAASPALHSGERVFLFKNTRAVPLEDSREHKGDPRKRSAVRFSENRSVPPSRAQGRRSCSSSSDRESGHQNRAHSVLVAEYSESGDEASTTTRPSGRDTTGKTSSSEHVMQPFRSSLSVGCLRRIDPGGSHDDDDEEEEEREEEDNRSDGDGGNDGRGGTTTQRYAASKRPIRSEFSRSLPRLVWPHPPLLSCHRLPPRYHLSRFRLSLSDLSPVQSNRVCLRPPDPAASCPRWLA